MADKIPHKFSNLAEELIGDLRGIYQPQHHRQVKRATKPAAEFIQALINKYHVGESSPAQALRDRWPEIVTPILAAYSHVAEISESGWLVVIVSNSVAKQELSNNRRLFLSRIKATPGCDSIKGINFRAG
jgi:hypothetical protein